MNKIKICCHCKENKPLSEYFISKRTFDGHWHWCKECEQKARNDIWDRVSCWCCPLQSKKDLEKLKINRPKLYSKLIELNNICPLMHRLKYNI